MKPKAIETTTVHNKEYCTYIPVIPNDYSKPPFSPFLFETPRFMALKEGLSFTSNPKGTDMDASDKNQNSHTINKWQCKPLHIDGAKLWWNPEFRAFCIACLSFDPWDKEKCHSTTGIDIHAHVGDVVQYTVSHIGTAKPDEKEEDNSKPDDSEGYSYLPML